MDKYNIIFTSVFYNLILVVLKKNEILFILHSFILMENYILRYPFPFNFQYFFLFNFLKKKKK